MVRIESNSVRLKKANGKIITVPVSKLNKADQDYLTSISKVTKVSESPKATPDYVIANIRFFVTLQPFEAFVGGSDGSWPFVR